MAVPLTSESAYRDTREQKIKQLVRPRRHPRARPLALADNSMEVPGINFVAVAGLEHALKGWLRCGRADGPGKLQIRGAGGMQKRDWSSTDPI